MTGYAFCDGVYIVRTVVYISWETDGMSLTDFRIYLDPAA